jgi:hypothetical protein
MEHLQKLITFGENIEQFLCDSTANNVASKSIGFDVGVFMTVLLNL